jgi:valine--pyruvate aminotransferase
MSSPWSLVGEKLSSRTGILELMHDLGSAMAGTEKLLMLGGGNPAAIPAMQALWKAELRAMLDAPTGDLLGAALANYDTPRGSPSFLRELAAFLRRHYGWDVTERNLVVTNGSQSAFFLLFNLLAGRMPDGSFGRILLPVSPEYIGYADQGLDPDLFVSVPPRIEHLDRHTFKYRVDFDALRITPDIRAICVSRPTNPSGNVLTDDEVARLAALARQHDIPLILDNAYGAPFPGILFREIQPYWDPNTILGLSLSKLGLPGTRTGILVAPEPVAEAIANMNAVAALANGNLGQALVEPLLRDDSILTCARDIIRPFYEQRSLQALAWLRESMPDDLPWRVHACEGALFLWLWCEGLPISSQELYQRLRRRGVLVVSGHYYFFGRPDAPAQAKECIRINYSQAPEIVQPGLRLIGEEITRAYREGK